MAILKFNKLEIISDLQKSAVQFEFAKRFNLILASGKNSVGKTSVVKNIFWCLGCDPRFDTKWKSLDCKVFIEFEVDSKKYYVARNSDKYFLSVDGVLYDVYVGLSSGFSERMAKIFKFNALLPVRNKNEVVTPPPAFYFLPFYIDQKESWSNAWNGFDKLSQFSSWKKEIIPYHVGITKKGYFDLTEEIFSTKREVESVKSEIERVDIAINVVNEFVPNVETTLNLSEFDDIQEELQKDIFSLHQEQEALFEDIASLRSSKAHIISQLDISREAVNELEEDYEFSQEHDDEILCPTCGVKHDNTLVSRFSLLEDKDQAEQIVLRLSKELREIELQLLDKEKVFSDIRSKIDKLDDKYQREDGSSLSTMQNILDSVAAHSVKYKVVGHRSKKIECLHGLESREARLTKSRAESSKDSRKTVKESFQDLYPSYIAKLRAFGVDSGSIKSPLDYNKVAKSGGGAESTRAMLAYYLAVYRLVYLHGEEVLSPLVIDTPNQHEQAAKHYKSIVSLIGESTPRESQVFLCGMDSKKLSPLKEEGKVFILEDEHALLNESNYENVKENIGWIFELSADES